MFFYLYFYLQIIIFSGFNTYLFRKSEVFPKRLAYLPLMLCLAGLSIVFFCDEKQSTAEFVLFIYASIIFLVLLTFQSILIHSKKYLTQGLLLKASSLISWSSMNAFLIAIINDKFFNFNFLGKTDEGSGFLTGFFLSAVYVLYKIKT